MDELFNQHVHFDSYDDFCSAFRVSEKKYYTNFVVASSQKLKIDGIFTADIVEKFKYRRIVYKCKYHGEPKANDARQRDTKTYKRGCQAYFAVSYKKCDFDRRFRLIITEFHIEHNHLLSKENFDSLPRQRNEKLQKHGAFVKQAAEIKSNNRLLQLKINELAENDGGGYVTLKDIHNYKQKRKFFIIGAMSALKE